MAWRAAGALTGALSAAVLAGCSVNPATGERELSLIGEQQEIQMGREADQQVVATLGVYDDPELTSYVQSLGARLAATSERPDLPWTFRVIDDPTVNAFALPGGFIYVTRGILTHLSSEAELVGVLGHEIGHVTARHSVTQMSRAQLTQIGLGLGMILIPDLRPFGDLASVGLQLLALSYGRGDENEADELGVRYMGRTSYDPRQLAAVMRMLERTSEIGEGSGRVPEWLSTHPDPGNRAQHIEQVAQASGLDSRGAAVGRNEYLRRIDGVVFGADPREGIFEQSLFRHPGLAFRIEFPSGWQTLNTKQAVQAVSPAQDAAMELTLADGSPAQALDRFAAQQGVQMARASQRSVNGLPAALAEFQVSAEEGTFQGLALFVEHGGRTYQIIGYAPAARWATNRDAVHGSLASFERETDPRVLHVQPDRLRLVQLDRSYTLQTFLERYPSDQEPEVVALINGLESGAALPAGTLAKRVVSGS